MRTQSLEIGILILAGLVLGGDETGPPRLSPQAAGILLKHCTLDYKRSSLLCANQIGVLEDCRVAPGDRVKTGQILGHLRDEEFCAERDACAAQAASDIAVRVAQARHKLAVSKLERTQRLINRNFASVEELNIQSQEEEAERLSIEDARQKKKVAELQQRQTEATIRSREIRSPHDGVVVEVLKVPGQSISGLDSVFRVVDPSELRVTGYLDVTDAWRVRPGFAVKIWVDISAPTWRSRRRPLLARWSTSTCRSAPRVERARSRPSWPTARIVCGRGSRRSWKSNSMGGQPVPGRHCDENCHQRWNSEPRPVSRPLADLND